MAAQGRDLPGTRDVARATPDFRLIGQLCLGQHGTVDHVFAQFYPVLRRVMQTGPMVALRYE